MEGGLRRRLRRARLASRRKPVQAGDRESLFIASWDGSAMSPHHAMPAISAWSIARRSDGRATASGDIEPSADSFSPMARRLRTDGRGATGPLIRDRIATARVLRFTLRARPVGPVAQWLEPAAHNGLVAGSKSCPAHQSFKDLRSLSSVKESPHFTPLIRLPADRACRLVLIVGRKMAVVAHDHLLARSEEVRDLASRQAARDEP